MMEKSSIFRLGPVPGWHLTPRSSVNETDKSQMNTQLYCDGMITINPWTARCLVSAMLTGSKPYSSVVLVIFLLQVFWL